MTISLISRHWSNRSSLRTLSVRTSSMLEPSILKSPAGAILRF
jgi:hypothetical protein